MADVEDSHALTKAFSGLGVNEKTIISIVGKWRSEHTNSFRKESEFFVKDDHHLALHKWNNAIVKLLELEFLRLKEAVVLWTMHPWERDARMIKESLMKGTSQAYGLIIEIACTRSSEELLGARKAYHSLFERSVEEDTAHRVTDNNRQLLVGLVSAYRYEGARVKEESAKSDAKILANAIKISSGIKNEEVVRMILTTRSKPYLKAVFKHYKELYGKNIDEDVNKDDVMLIETVACLGSPNTYFSKVVDKALKANADEHTKDALTRVVVTRADTGDMKGIKEEYQKLFGIPLVQKVEEIANGSYKEFLLTLIARGE